MTIRERNPVEQGSGGREGLGPGSLTTVSAAPDGIAGSPATFSPDLINQIDVGQVLAGVAGS